MSDYTPTTEEIREYVEVGGEPRPWEPVTEESDALDARRAAAFDRWLADHDREVAAKALEDAAAFFENEVGPDTFDELTSSDGTHWEHIEESWEHQGPFMEWLRARAARIREGDTK